MPIKANTEKSPLARDFGLNLMVSARLPGFGSILVIAFLTTQASAKSAFPLDGVFGNAEGCRVYETGLLVARYLVLTGDTFSSTEVGCAFESPASVKDGVVTGKAICSPGGRQIVHVIDHGSGGYGFVIGEGPEYGPLVACSPAAITG